MYDTVMSQSLTVELPDEMMEALQKLAEDQCRTPEAQVFWLIRRAVRSRYSVRTPEERRGDTEPLFAELTTLYLNAGAPSTRKLSAATRAGIAGAEGSGVGHSTIHDALRGARLPAWTILEQIVIALHGDAEHFRQLWMTARSGGVQVPAS